MEERFALLYLKTSGIKCLARPIEIQFANRRIDDNFVSRPLVKAIYGTNGEGKTAIAHTLDIYKNSVLTPDYLAGESYIGTFEQIVNHKLNSVSVDLYFAFIDDSNRKNIYHHLIEYGLRDKTLSICHEAFHYCGRNIWGYPSKEIKIFETKNGEFTYITPIIKKYESTIKESTRNLLSGTSALGTIVFGCFVKNKKFIKALNEKEVDFVDYVLDGLSFALHLNVYLDEKDKHVNSYSKLSSLLESVRGNEIGSKERKFLIDNETDEIDISDFRQYQKDIEKVCNFLKVFKPDLDRIDIKKSDNRNKRICKKILIYKNGDKVPLEFESTGVKKLIRLYQYLNKVDAGEISFIDEFDSNIHDVYLCKLIEYFIRYTNGQLIFTTHNLGPMQVLSESGLKHSIDFINDSFVTSWKKNGNYSVVNLYRSGLIPNSPFNIDAVNFVRVFGEDKADE